MMQPEKPSQREVFQQLDRCAEYPYPLREYIRRFLWELVQAVLIRYSFKRAHGWRRFWLRRFGAQIPAISGTKRSTTVVHPWLLRVGSHSILSENVTVYNLGMITIGDHTVISQEVYLCAGTHDYTRADLPLIRSSITIGSGVWICAGAFIGPGVTIGDNAVIGARAVVMKDVPAAMVVAGNPAKVIKPRKMIWEAEIDQPDPDSSITG